MDEVGRKMNIRILFVGDGSYPMYARALFEAASEVDGGTAQLLDYGSMNIKCIHKEAVVKRAEYHYCLGPDVNKINRGLIHLCESGKFDIVFLYSAELIYESTIKELKRFGIYVAVYHNDDPFSPRRSKYRLRHFLRAIKHADIAYAYRIANIDDYYSYGAPLAKMLRSYYIKSRNYYIQDSELNNRSAIPGIAFVGHYEDDGRLEYIKALTAKGVDVGVISDWPILNNHMKVIERADADYNVILNQLDIAIIFLSSLNSDTYTRRCFEIPMTKTMMLSVYTEDIASMYEEGREIVFFKTPEEFAEKAVYYLEHDEERNMIAGAAYERCLRDGHEAADRVREIITDYGNSRNI